MRILGLDPGSRHTGYGVIEKRGSKLTPLAHGRLSSKNDALATRIVELTDGLEGLLTTWSPEVVALETLFQGLNPRSLIVLAQARGALLAVLARRDLPIVEYSPAEVKTAVTGYGRADKEQVIRMVRMILSIRDSPLPADAADALAIAACCAQRHRFDSLANRP